MKKTNVRVMAFLLLLAMLISAVAPVTALAAESTGTLSLNFSPEVEGVEATCDGVDVENNEVEDLDVGIAHTIKLNILEEVAYVFKSNGQKNHTEVVNPVNGSVHGDWVYQEEDNTKAWKAIKNFELEKEVKATEGTINIKLKVDGKVIDKVTDIPDGLGMKLDTSKVAPFVFKLDKVKIKEDHTVKFQLDTQSKYIIDGDSEFKIDKLTQLSKPGDWKQKTAGKDVWETDIEINLKSKSVGTVRVFYEFPDKSNQYVYLVDKDGKEERVLNSGVIVEANQEYTVIVKQLKAKESLIINPITGDDNLSMSGNDVKLKAPLGPKSITMKLAIQKDMGDYYLLKEAKAGKTTVILQLKSDEIASKIDSIYGIYKGVMGNKKSTLLKDNIVIVHLNDEIEKVGEEIGLIAQNKDGSFSQVTTIKSQYIDIPIKVEAVKAGDKKVKGTTEPEAKVFITREGFDDPITADADKKGEFEVHVVTELKGEEVFQIYAKLEPNKLSDTLEIEVPKEDVVYKATRLYGENRYLTAVDVSQAYFPIKSDIKPKTVIIAAGGKTADALAAGPLAIKHGAPILLVDKDSIPAKVLDEIKRLNPDKIIIVGGESSVSELNEKALKALDKEVVRLYGDNRYNTALEVAKYIGDKFTLKGFILANGSEAKDADALAVSGYAAKNNLAILLTSENALPEGVNVFLKANADHVEIVGGENSVAKAIETELGDIFKGRTQGSTRFLTAIELAKKTFKDTKAVVLVNATKSVDALAAAPYAYAKEMAILLTGVDKIQADTLNYIKETKVEEVTVIGGPASVADTVMKEFEALTPKVETEVTE